MRMFAVVGFVAALTSSAGAQDAPKMPAPQKEHEWLKQFVGEWVLESEMVVEPGKPPVKCKGTENVRLLGGFWMVSDLRGEFMGTPVHGVMTLGYDAQKKKYVGTWVCSVSDFMCKYEGTVAGNVLTLETEAHDPATGKLVKMRDVCEMKDADTRVMTSSALADGKWVPFMTMTARRKK